MNRPDWKELPERAVQNRILELTDTRGSIAMFTPIQSILISRVQGHLSEAFADSWLKATAPVLARGSSLNVFNDWGAMESYDSAARRKLTDWAMLNRKQIRGTYFTTTSRIVSMGVAVAGAALAIASVKLESLSREEFLARLEKALVLGSPA